MPASADTFRSSASATGRCPLCNGAAGGSAFPYETFFDGQTFTYRRCTICSTVFADPMPSPATFAKMYAKDAYHDIGYENADLGWYRQSVKALIGTIGMGASVLDYGCGLGHFLVALKEQGFKPVGVEFDPEAAKAAAERTGCEVVTVDNFWRTHGNRTFDVLHFGDVLEHAPDPGPVVRKLLKHVREGGYVFMEGPLEANPSLVYWASAVFGAAKRLLRPGFVATDAPVHLFRTNARAQADFFTQRFPELKCIRLGVFETGFPYSQGGFVKRCIARAAKALNGRTLGGVPFGNRFRAVYRYAQD